MKTYKTAVQEQMRYKKDKSQATANEQSARKKARRKQVGNAMNKPVSTGLTEDGFINRTSNSRKGQTYSTQKGSGGVWHIYNNQRVFVKKKKNTNQGAGNANSY